MSGGNAHTSKIRAARHKSRLAPIADAFSAYPEVGGVFQFHNKLGNLEAVLAPFVQALKAKNVILFADGCVDGTLPACCPALYCNCFTARLNGKKWLLAPHAEISASVACVYSLMSSWITGPAHCVRNHNFIAEIFGKSIHGGVIQDRVNRANSR